MEKLTKQEKEIAIDVDNKESHLDDLILLQKIDLKTYSTKYAEQLERDPRLNKVDNLYREFLQRRQRNLQLAASDLRRAGYAQVVVNVAKQLKAKEGDK